MSLLPPPPYNNRLVFYNTIVLLLSVKAVYRQKQKRLLWVYNASWHRCPTANPCLIPLALFPQYTIRVILFKSECLGLGFLKAFCYVRLNTKLPNRISRAGLLLLLR